MREILIAHLRQAAKSKSSPKLSKVSLGFTTDHSGEVTDLPKRGQETADHRHVVLVKGL